MTSAGTIALGLVLITGRWRIAATTRESALMFSAIGASFVCWGVSGTASQLVRWNESLIWWGAPTFAVANTFALVGLVVRFRITKRRHDALRTR